MQLTTNANVGLYVKTDGNIGAGINNPTRQLDVNIRMRIRGTANNINNSAGIFFDGVTDIERAFIGIETNDKIGISGAGSGWGLSMNVITGNTNMYNSVAIGTTAAPNSKLQVTGSLSLPYISINNQNYNVTDNDYSIHIITPATGADRTITLPSAQNRLGRIYMISAEIPNSENVANNNSKVMVMDGGTGTNVIGRADIGQGIGPANYLANKTNIFVIDNFNRILYLKQLSITVQSDGTNWIVIHNDFASTDWNDYFD